MFRTILFLVLCANRSNCHFERSAKRGVEKSHFEKNCARKPSSCINRVVLSFASSDKKLQECNKCCRAAKKRGSSRAYILKCHYAPRAATLSFRLSEAHGEISTLFTPSCGGGLRGWAPPNVISTEVSVANGVEKSLPHFTPSCGGGSRGWAFPQMSLRPAR